MGDFVSEYGGDLVTIPLSNFLNRGRGDDFLLQPERLPGRHSYGTLNIVNSYCGSRIDDDYARAVAALEGQNDNIMLVCVEDPESASPYLFVRKVNKDNKEYAFPIIFNAELWCYADDGEFFGSGEESFNLCLGDIIDPERKCAVRIIYAPGKRIEWSEEELKELFSRV